MKITTLVPLLFFTIISRSQPIEFAVLRGDSQIGEIQASISQKDNFIHYDVVSDVSFRIIWKYNRISGLHVTYINNMLESSLSTAAINDKLKELSRVTKSGSQYDCFIYPNDSFQLKPDINFSTVRLYFEEPVGISKIYSESFLDFGTLESLGDHVYKLTLPDESINYYTYKNGELTEVSVNRTLFNLTFKRKT